MRAPPRGAPEGKPPDRRDVQPKARSRIGCCRRPPPRRSRAGPRPASCTAAELVVEGPPSDWRSWPGKARRTRCGSSRRCRRSAAGSRAPRRPPSRPSGGPPARARSSSCRRRRPGPAGDRARCPGPPAVAHDAVPPRRTGGSTSGTSPSGRAGSAAPAQDVGTPRPRRHARCAPGGEPEGAPEERLASVRGTGGRRRRGPQRRTRGRPRRWQDAGTTTTARRLRRTGAAGTRGRRSCPWTRSGIGTVSRERTRVGLVRRTLRPGPSAYRRPARRGGWRRRAPA